MQGNNLEAHAWQQSKQLACCKSIMEYAPIFIRCTGLNYISVQFSSIIVDNKVIMRIHSTIPSSGLNYISVQFSSIVVVNKVIMRIHRTIPSSTTSLHANILKFIHKLELLSFEICRTAQFQLSTFIILDHGIMAVISYPTHVATH